MANFIMFTDKKMFIVSALSNMGHKIRRLRIQKLNHLAGALSCWKPQKLNSSHKCVKVVVLGVFVATMVKLQQLVINKPDKACHRHRAAIQQVCQNRLRQPSLYSRHTMTSALRHD